MTEEHLAALLAAVEAKKNDKGWSVASEGRSLTLYAAYNGASLSVGRVEAVRSEQKLLYARTKKGEIYILALADVYAGAAEESPTVARKAGFA